MKIAPKLAIVAVLSLLIGIVAATPLLVNELNIKPWTNHVQGPTARFSIDTLYANFTIENADTPLTINSGPTIHYLAVVNVTNPSDYAARLYSLFFGAGKTVTNTTSQGGLGLSGNWSSGSGFEAKGAWVDGVWYNVTYVDGSYPVFDQNGTMIQSPFNSSSSNNGYWMEGVQGYERTVHNDEGTTTYTYLNMNGTWTDVTGRITVDKKAQNSPTYAINGSVANQNLFFQRGNVSVATSNPNDPNPLLKWIDTGEGGFDNLFAPHESRLIVIQGIWEARSYNTNANPVATLQSGILSLYTMTHNAVDVNTVVDDRTFMDTRSVDTVVQQIPLTQIGNSYVYNAVLGANQKFQFDQSGAEAFIIQES
jgi:hypothetical protein